MKYFCINNPMYKHGMSGTKLYEVWQSMKKRCYGIYNISYKNYGARCMLTGIKTKKLSFHHIYKKQFGGQATKENGANITRGIHDYLHEQESKNIELYYLINDCLLCYKECLDRGLTEEVEMYENEIMPKYREELERRLKR